VSERSVRRYVAMLQDMGVPVEAGRGRHGAYRIRPGFKLPPLMFAEDEALALVLGLLVSRRLGSPAEAGAVEGALAKVERVMPERLRERVRALQDALTLTLSVPYDSPASDTLLTLSEAVQRGRLVRLRYQSWRGDETEREFEPYGVVYYKGRWFAAGHCRLRRALRSFRLDRVLSAELLAETFARPDGVDTLALVERSLAETPGTYRVEVVLETTLAEARRLVSPAVALMEGHDGGVLLRCNTQELDWVAHMLAGLCCRLRVLGPPELRAALRQLAVHAASLAEL
jgi:predicted DNA-binding transcriptional regulator YafY